MIDFNAGRSLQAVPGSRLSARQRLKPEVGSWNAVVCPHFYPNRLLKNSPNLSFRGAVGAQRSLYKHCGC